MGYRDSIMKRFYDLDVGVIKFDGINIMKSNVK